MAWSSGFFNSVNGDRLYNANQLSAIFEGLIGNGIYESVGNKLAVQPNSGMTVQIATGRGYFNGHWVKNDTEHLLKLNAADVTLNRYAAVCIRVDESDSARTAEPYIKYGDLAASPTKPSMENSELVKEYCLAYIYIKAKATQITEADIEDTRATNLCGWVTGLIKQVDTNTLWTQWQANFNQFINERDKDWADFIEASTNEITGFLSTHESVIDAWTANQKTEFLTWFNGLQSLLSSNAEAQLAADMFDLQLKLGEAKIKWNGDTTGLEVFTLNGYNCYKVSDLILTAEELVGLTVTRTYPEASTSSDDVIGTDTWNKVFTYTNYLLTLFGVVIVKNSAAGAPTGIYFANQAKTSENPAYYVSALELPNNDQMIKDTAVTIDGLGWSSQANGYYSQDVTVKGVTYDNDIIVAPEQGYEQYYVNMGCEVVAQSPDTITLNCDNPDDIDIPLKVIILQL